MKHLIASTAITLAFVSPAFAGAHADGVFIPSVSADAVYSSDLVGARLYTSEVEVDLEMNEIDQNWNDVGEISDVVIDKDGEIRAVLADIGGFLGLGEKTIAVSMDQLKFVSDGDDADEYFVVLQVSDEMLDTAPAFTFDSETDMDTTTTESAATNTMSENKLYSEARDYRFTPPVIQRDGFVLAEVDKLTTEDVTGAPVYDTNDEWIGEVHTIVLDGNGKLGDAILDIGGFLGLGEKQIAVNFSELTLQRQDGGNEVRIYIDATEEQLKNLPEVDM